MSVKEFCIKYFKKIFHCTVISFLLSGESFANNGQASGNFDTIFINERNNFLHTVRLIPADTAVSYPIIRNFEYQLNSIVIYLEKIQTLTTIEKEKAKRSLLFFLQEINKSLTKNRIHLFELSEAVVSYRKVLMAVLQQKPLVPLLALLELKDCELIAAAFTQYKESSLLNDVVTYKRVSTSPEFILPFLEAKPGFRFADSLLLDVVLHNPMSVVYYLRRVNPILQQQIQSTSNTYVQRIASISDYKYASDLTLFIPQMDKGIISEDEIFSTRADPSKYFQLLVNTLQNSKSSIPSEFLHPLRNGIREKALNFYVNEINDLHNSTDAVRFASVNGLRMQDLYFIITTCGDELYTSSYLGLYKRMMAQFNNQPADYIFDIVQGENFHVFIRMAANYNVLEDFLEKLSSEKKLEVLRLYISNIEKDQNTALEKAMDIADSFGALNKSPQISDIIQAEIETNLNRCISEENYLGKRLYSILNDMLKLTRQEDGLKKLWNVLGDYETLTHSSLSNSQSEITELVLFYGDEDGVASFNNFLKNYTDKSKWLVFRNKQWISIKSLTSGHLTIYANFPLNMEKQFDIAAQDSLFNHLKANGLEPSIVVHRGHSYHLDKTLKRLTPSVKLMILGSCGGYNKAISIASINTDVQVIGSKKAGSKSINDPILDMVNTSLSNSKDLSWPEIWKKLENHFKKDEAMLTQFNEYFSPSNNLGLFILKLYNANNKLL